MIHRGFAVVLFSVCVVLALLSASPYGASQSFTTLTTVQSLTFTSLSSLSSTWTSTTVTVQTVHYDLTPSDFNSQTGTFLLGFTEVGTAPYFPDNSVCLMYDYFLVNATSAYGFKIHFDTQQDIPIHFLILNMKQLNRFNHTNCTQGFSDWELRVVAPAADLEWIVPQPGEYAFLFLSRQFVGGYVHFTAQALSPIIQTTTSTYTTITIIQALTTQTSLSTLAAGGAAPTSWIPFAIVAAILAVVTGIIYRKKRGSVKNASAEKGKHMNPAND